MRDGLRFELLNEIVLPASDPWNALAVRSIEAIRQIDPERDIIIGGNKYNDVQELKNLVVVDDQQVHYTFHFYRPMLFTHQRAYWMQIGRQFSETVHYPGSVPNLGQFLQANPEFQESFGNQVEQEMNGELLRQELQPAVDFMAEHGRSLYCGEFGVIDQAPAASSVRWHADLLALLRELGIGWALWSYKRMDFGLVDENSHVVNNELINLLLHNQYG